MSELLTSTAAVTTGTRTRRAAAGPAPASTRHLPWSVKASAACVVAYLAALLLSDGTGLVSAFTNVSFLLFPALAAHSCWNAARTHGPSQRRTWRLAAVAMTVYACGGLVWLSYAARGTSVPVPSLGELGFLGYALPLIAALAALPIAGRARSARAEIVLDCVVIFTSVLFCVWVLVLLPLGEQTADRGALEVATLYAYPAVDVLVLSAVFSTVMRVRSRDIRAWLTLLLGFSLIAVGDLLYVGLVADGTYDAAAPYNCLWAVAFLLVALAPHLGRLAEPGGWRLTIGRALVPYLAMAAAVGVGIGTQVSLRENRAVFGLALTLAAAALVRQFVVVVVKTRLADDLEAEAGNATAALSGEREFLAAVVDNLHAGIFACDRDGNLTLHNRAAALFHSDPDLTRTDMWSTDLRSADGTAVLRLEQSPLMHALAGGTVDDLELMIIPPHAPAVAVTASGRALRGADGEIVGAVVALHDVTERRRQQMGLERKAAQDELTGLGNRRAFKAETSRRLAADLPVALLLLDLDDFKHINDSLGHDAGDQCLVDVAQTIWRSLPEHGTAYRLGGDEFVIVLDPTQADPQVCAEQILTAVNDLKGVPGTDVRITASIGVALRSTQSDTARELLQAADLAMYVAKAAGKAGVSIYQEHMRGEAHQRLSLEADLRNAIDNGELFLQYQPIVELATGRMTAAEAFVRWTHPTRGPVSPVEFIPIAEQCGEILPLGEWVLHEAASQLLRWDAQGGARDFRITVNVSTRQLERPGLLEVLDSCLAAGVHPSRLVLEVTETALTIDSATALETMHAIRARGVQLAVDDFGTGYSSLSRLRSAPVSRIKIDRSFVSEIVATDSHVPIVEATMAMARGLGMGVIAEGVETPQQLAYLTLQGCPEAQGYLLSRPLTADGLFTCMTTPPWTAVLSQTTTAVPPSSRFQHLIALAVDPQVTLEDLVRPLLADLHAATGLSMTYLTRVRADSDVQEVTFVESVTPGPVREEMTVPWSASLCQHALEHGPRRSSAPEADFQDMPIVRELGLEAYVVEPVNDADGVLYGTLCGASTQPHQLRENDSAALRLYARLIEQKLQGSTPDSRVADRTAPGAVGARRRRAEQLWQATSNDLVSTSASAAVLEQRGRRIAATDRAWSDQCRTLAARDDSGDRRLRVVIADDEEMLRALLSAVLEGEPSMRVVGAADGAWSTVGVVAAEQPDILVLDYDLGDGNASDVIGFIRLLSPGTRVLLHSARSDVHSLGQQMQVDRVMPKGDGASRLPDALRTLAYGSPLI